MPGSLIGRALSPFAGVSSSDWVFRLGQRNLPSDLNRELQGIEQEFTDTESRVCPCHYVSRI